MEPNGLLVTTLVIGLFVFAMGVDNATSDIEKHPKDATAHGGKGKNNNNAHG